MRGPIFLLIWLAVLSAPVRGIDIGGRLTSSLYTYENLKTDTTSAVYLRAYQSVSLEVAHLGLPELSAHTYLRGTTDLSRQADTDPRLHLFSGYLTWKKPRYQLQFGRQQILAGAGSGTIDGGRGDFDLADFLLTLYAGTLAPSDRSAALGSWSEGHLWGARLSTRRFYATEAAISLASREREPEAYADSGRYSGFKGQPGAIVQRLVCLDLGRRFSAGHSLYARLDYDLMDQDLRRIEASARYAFSARLAAQGEWFRRSSALFANSIFSVFPGQDYQEIGGRLYYTLKPQLQLIAHFATVLYDGDSARRLGLTAAFGEHYSLGFYRSAGGYSLPGDGLVGSVYYPLGRKFAFTGELDLIDYERIAGADDRDDLFSGLLGLTYRPTRKTFFELQLQGLRNPLYASDTRLFLRGSWRFLKRGER
jgi:hypothetical protein